MSWQTVIGLEVHAQINTQTKLFSPSSTAYGADANSQASFIDAGLPGTLPILNEAVLAKAIQFGLAINGSIVNDSEFERKNYFYPDLPKGYQISQFKHPIIEGGYLNINLQNGQQKKIDITRAHLEEDAGKSVHDVFFNQTGVDLNRAGTPLLEIVTEPCMHSAEEAISYLKTLHKLVQFLDLCDGNMQEGSFRCDVNLSIRQQGSKTLGTRTELKNLNSFRFIEKAISYEQARHQKVLESGGAISQETRLYNADEEATYPMRQKENENDYRYFPDPDLLPLSVDSELLQRCRNTLPKLPQEIESQLRSHNSMSNEDIDYLLQSPAVWQFYQALVNETRVDYSSTAINWLKGPYAAALKTANKSYADYPLVPAIKLGSLLNALGEQKITHGEAKTIFKQLIEDNNAVVVELIDAIKSGQMDEGQLSILIEQLIAVNPKQAEAFKNGQDKLLGFFVGQIMKQTHGKASPQQVNELVLKKLRP